MPERNRSVHPSRSRQGGRRVSHILADEAQLQCPTFYRSACTRYDVPQVPARAPSTWRAGGSMEALSKTSDVGTGELFQELVVYDKWAFLLMVSSSQRPQPTGNIMRGLTRCYLPRKVLVQAHLVCRGERRARGYLSLIILLAERNASCWES